MEFVRPFDLRIRGRNATLCSLLFVAACAEPRARAQVGDSAPPADTAAATAAPDTPTVATPSPAAYLITPTSMGGIALGATPGDIRRSMPAAHFERDFDAEGIALIALTLSPGATLILWTDEDPGAADIDWSRPIRMIETTSPAFATPEGIHAGTRVADVVPHYGPVREVIESEIESRQYITFERQPSHLTFRLDYSGVFAPGARTTKTVAPDGAIHSIAIATDP